MSASKPVFSREDILRGIRQSRETYKGMKERSNASGPYCYNTHDRWQHMIEAFDYLLALYAEEGEK